MVSVLTRDCACAILVAHACRQSQFRPPGPEVTPGDRLALRDAFGRNLTMAANRSQSFGNTCYLEIPDLGGYGTNFPAVFLQATVSGPARAGVAGRAAGHSGRRLSRHFTTSVPTGTGDSWVTRASDSVWITTCTRSTEADVIRHNGMTGSLILKYPALVCNDWANRMIATWARLFRSEGRSSLGARAGALPAEPAGTRPCGRPGGSCTPHRLTPASPVPTPGPAPGRHNHDDGASWWF